jgi:lysophospholipase L1-like esterase
MKVISVLLAIAGMVCAPASAIATERFSIPIIAGDSWSNDLNDWPNFTTTVQWSEYKHHAIGGEWLSVEDAVNQYGIAANISDYLDLHPDADSIIIQGGVNDFKHDVTAEVVQAALTDIVAEVKSRGNILDIIVVSPGPYGGAWTWQLSEQAELDRYLEWLPGFCASQNITYYSAYDAVGDPNNPIVISRGDDGTPDYDLDGSHVNLAGAAKLATDIDALIQLIRGAPKRIDIDLDPWSADNIVRPSSNNSIPVAFLSRTGEASELLNFDPAQIDPDSVRFGLGEAPNTAVPLLLDFNGDSQNDVVLGFETQSSGIACSDTEVGLYGATYAGDPFVGVAPIDATDCVETGCHP